MSDKESQHLFVACPVLRGLLLVRCEHRGDKLRQGAGVADLQKAFFLNELIDIECRVRLVPKIAKQVAKAGTGEGAIEIAQHKKCPLGWRHRASIHICLGTIESGAYLAKKKLYQRRAELRRRLCWP